MDDLLLSPSIRFATLGTRQTIVCNAVRQKTLVFGVCREKKNRPRDIRFDRIARATQTAKSRKVLGFCVVLVFGLHMAPARDLQISEWDK